MTMKPIRLLSLLLLCSITSGKDRATDHSAKRRRTIFAWANGDPKAAAQLRSEKWSGVFDGVQAFCGASFHGSGIAIDQVEWEKCLALTKAVRDAGMKFHLVVTGKVPNQVLTNPQAIISAAVDLASQYNLDGFSLDDDYDCGLKDWIGFIDSFAQGLHSRDLELSAVVQAMDKGKSDPEVVSLMSQSNVDRWLEMDTYSSTGTFLNALDWYVDNVAKDKLAVAMMNKESASEDSLLARFYAIDKSDIDAISIFLLPANNMILPFLQRWKTHCSGYDLDIPCPKAGSSSGASQQ